MNKINAKKRNKRPQCGANAPTFLSAVYKRGTQAKKRQAGAPQSGRSMIEMLGVLAIIGVLSVGGIMGYSKAMTRYRINKTIEQITYIAGNVRTTFANQGNYDGLNGNTTIWKKSHIVPDDMWKEGENYPQSVWGDNVYLSATTKNYADTHNKAFRIIYPNLPEDACIELLTHDWSNAGVNWIHVNRVENEYFNNTDSDVYFPIDVDLATRVCATIPDDPLVWQIDFYFDIDVNYYKEDRQDCLANDGKVC